MESLVWHAMAVVVLGAGVAIIVALAAMFVRMAIDIWRDGW